MVEFHSLTFPRFPLRKKEHKSYFGKNRTHDFRTSRGAGYLLDHLGTYDRIVTIIAAPESVKKDLYGSVSVKTSKKILWEARRPGRRMLHCSRAVGETGVVTIGGA